jgi:hypothetical protein
MREATFGLCHGPDDVQPARVPLHVNRGRLDVAEHRPSKTAQEMAHGPAARAGRQGGIIATRDDQSAKKGPSQLCSQGTSELGANRGPSRLSLAGEVG